MAGTYQAMGLLAADRPTNWYDPGRFWSGDNLQLEGGATLGTEIRVIVDQPAAVEAPQRDPVRGWAGRSGWGSSPARGG